MVILQITNVFWFLAFLYNPSYLARNTHISIKCTFLIWGTKYLHLFLFFPIMNFLENWTLTHSTFSPICFHSSVVVSKHQHVTLYFCKHDLHILQWWSRGKTGFTRSQMPSLACSYAGPCWQFPAGRTLL